MGRPPAYVFVVRHGNRLDAADKQWHLTSPTPYDPPLTYGGWQQSKSVGARIASILQDSDLENGNAQNFAPRPHPTGHETQGDTPGEKRRFRVIIHSSPFLRCIQTSIGISAGLAANPAQSIVNANGLKAQAKSSHVPRVSSFSNPAPTRTRPTISTDAALHQIPSPDHMDKTTLRLDPFLGEWASPDYFDHITPPPESGLMMMTAKAELLRKENYHSSPHFQTRDVPSTPSQLWNSPTRSSRLASFSENSYGASGLEGLSDLGNALPGAESDHQSGHRSSLSESGPSKGYVSPVPGYALSSAEPIPNGYVAHARDACVNIDFHWDSSRDPVAWGDGGILPEEWASMHQRFRRGLKSLVDWHATADHPGAVIPKSMSSSNLRSPEFMESAVEDGDDAEIENVVILVSHGAGCNALVGGITGQPVLADVPMASLSVAKRRAAFDDNDTNPDARAMASLDDAFARHKTTPELYELSVFANTDHLHSMSTAVARASSVSAASRGRGSGGLGSALRDINFGAYYGQNNNPSRGKTVNASLGSMRRSSHGPVATKQSPTIAPAASHKASVAGVSSAASFDAHGRKLSIGLWTPKQEPQDPEDEPDVPIALDNGLAKEQKPVGEMPPPPKMEGKPRTANGPVPVAAPIKKLDPKPVLESEEHDHFNEDAFPAFPAASGLWGTPLPPDEAEMKRDFSSQKRRWTVNER